MKPAFFLMAIIFFGFQCSGPLLPLPPNALPITGDDTSIDTYPRYYAIVSVDFVNAPEFNMQFAGSIGEQITWLYTEQTEAKPYCNIYGSFNLVFWFPSDGLDSQISCVIDLSSERLYDAHDYLKTIHMLPDKPGAFDSAQYCIFHPGSADEWGSAQLTDIYWNGFLKPSDIERTDNLCYDLKNTVGKIVLKFSYPLKKAAAENDLVSENGDETSDQESAAKSADAVQEPAKDASDDLGTIIVTVFYREEASSDYLE